MISFERISAKFNKHKSIHDKYTASRGSFTESGEIVLRFPEENGCWTLITTGAIEGFSHSAYHTEALLGVTDYNLVDRSGKLIENKSDFKLVSGILINRRSLFFMPNDAVLPLCNVLNHCRRISGAT